MKYHIWKYKNPYHRTCIICDEVQCEFCIAIEGQNIFRTKGFWETVYPLSNKKCVESFWDYLLTIYDIWRYGVTNENKNE